MYPETAGTDPAMSSDDWFGGATGTVSYKEREREKEKNFFHLLHVYMYMNIDIFM